jgi:transposase
MEALWLKSHGLPHAQIATFVDVSENTLRDYFRRYQAGGIEKLKEVTYYHPVSELDDHRETLQVYFAAHPPATTKEAQAAIAELTGIERGETQVREFLKKNLISGIEK